MITYKLSKKKDLKLRFLLGQAKKSKSRIDQPPNYIVELETLTTMRVRPLFYLFAICVFLSLIICSTAFAASHLYTIGWQDYQSNPVFDPATRAYYPTLAYDDSKFSSHGTAYYYKMWYSTGSKIGLAYSDNGKSWTEVGELPTLSTNASHPWIVYDAGGFGGSGVFYKIWYWDTSKIYGPAKSIAYAESTDGVSWTNKQNVFGGTGVGGDWNRGSYGPATVLYNSLASNSGTDPLDYSYAMYYDGTSGGTEEIGLASSTDGISWTRYGTDPVLPNGDPLDWDSTHNYPATVILADGKYRMWFSGGAGASNRGIGYAESDDGISWTKSTNNPIVALGGYGAFGGFGPPGSWNEVRNYTPAVLYDPAQFNGHGDPYYYKMWRTGRSAGSNYTVGYSVGYLIFPATGLNTGAIMIFSLVALIVGLAVTRKFKFFSASR